MAAGEHRGTLRMQDWTIIADDLTGACDTGVVFARRGLPTRVAFTAEADFSGAKVRVVTTESRALPEEEAARAVERAIETMELSGESRIYKKIDSTLRGHPGAELAAVMRASGIERGLIAPAFPAQGRVVRGGRVFVHEKPLEQTSFGGEVGESNLLRLFGRAGQTESIRLQDIRQGAEWVTGIMRASSTPVLVADAETDEDLRVLIEASEEAGIRLLCGSAGLARALAERLPVIQGYENALTRRAGPVLAVVGSYHPIALRQIEIAREKGLRIISLKPGLFHVIRGEMLSQASRIGQDLPGGVKYIAGPITANLSWGESVVICLEDSGRLLGREVEIGEGLAGLATAALQGTRVGSLVLTGGETAARVCRALGCAAIDLGGEVQPGIAWGWLAGGKFSGLPVVTKAGGFGDENALVDIIRFLTE